MSNYFFKPFLTVIFLIFIQPYIGQSQTIWRTKTYNKTGVWVSEIYAQNLQNCNSQSNCTLNNISVGDIVIHPSGKFYIGGIGVQNEIRVLDTCNLIKVISVPNNIGDVSLSQSLYSLCADKEGQIYLSFSAKKNIYRFDPFNEIFLDLGILPNGMDVFDFTFRNGKLYAAGITGAISHIISNSG